MLRVLEKDQDEWLLICTGHNLLKLFRFGGAAHDKGSATPHLLHRVFASATFSQRDSVISPLFPLVSGPVSIPRTGCLALRVLTGRLKRNHQALPTTASS